MQKYYTITTPVKRMAAIARTISNLLGTSLEQDTASSALRTAYHQCRETGQSAMTGAEFADMASQLLIYSCFAARYYQSASEVVQRQHINSILSYAHPLHRQCVAAIMDMESQCATIAACIDEVMRLLAAINRESIHSNFQDDAPTHFYELFLRYYDPRLRASHGIFYTPEPIVSYIIRSLDHLLRARFACPAGLAEIDAAMHILDPACGTGVFVQAVLEHIQTAYQRHGQIEQWREHLHQHFLPRLSGIEVLLAPYLIAHMRLNLFLANVNASEPGPFHLGNALEADIHQEAPPSIMIVPGNPPYAGHSANKEARMLSLLDDYKEGCPELKRRAQAKWLSDDYVKFMRMAQWQIDKAGQGILAFITSHSYLDNPTFRGMRRSLMRSFDELFVLDLHGNSKKQEQSPGHTRDENVFAIQPGVAISLFVKSNRNHCRGGSGVDAGWGPLRSPSADTTSHCRGGSGGDAGWGPLRSPSSQNLPTIYHAHLWGSRAEKLAWLSTHDLESTSWTIQHPQAPYYLFAPQETQFLAEYEADWSIPDIFRPNGDPAPGIITCHDEFAVAWSRDEAICKIEQLLATRDEDEARQHYRLCRQAQWNYTAAKRALSEDNWQQQLTPILYRPFDTRWTVYNRHVAVHLRERVTRHMLPGQLPDGSKNLALLIGKAGQVIHQQAWDIVFCSRLMTEFNLFRRGGNNIFPLYLVRNDKQASRAVNLAPAFIADIVARLGLRWNGEGRGNLRQSMGPEDVFCYIYALLHSPTYRARYAPFLKRDFPRIPLTSSLALFRALCAMGEKLVRLHLMEGEIQPITGYPVNGNHRIEQIRYVPCEDDETMGRVWINATQFFECVPLVAWNLHIGGYQVCQKWLKDRRGRALNAEEIAQYQKIVAILAETAYSMQAIDRAIEDEGGWPI